MVTWAEEVTGIVDAVIEETAVCDRLVAVG